MQIYADCGAVLIIPVSLQTRRTGGVPWLTTAKLKAPAECISPFLGSLPELSQGQEDAQGLCLVPGSTSLAFRYVENLKPFPEAGGPDSVNRPFSRNSRVMFQSAISAVPGG